MDKNITKLLEIYHPNDPDLHQTVLDVYEDIEDFYKDHKVYVEHKIIDQLIEADRVIRFRICWEDDNHNIQINRGWRIQHQNNIGSYKGGIRFDSSVNESILQRLAFEQSFKNALTDLPIGSAKGGANFNPKNRSDNEIRRFCWAFIEELRKYIGTNHDVPAGDIGVGTREIGYMYGHYIHLEDKFTGVLTGKHPNFGGSSGREQATGYGCVYFLLNMLNAHDHDLKGKRIVISGTGNVALYAAEKALQKEAKVLALSDRSGFVCFKDGLTQDLLEEIKTLKFHNHGELSSWSKNKKDIEFHKNKKPWVVPCDIAMPCAVENEIEVSDLKNLIENNVLAICEGANMPLTKDAHKLRKKAKILYGPGVASNAGGVAVSVLEQSQQAQHISWSLKKVDSVLFTTMKGIHDRCLEHIHKYNGIYNYKKGAHIWSFKKLADTMVNYGIK